MCRIYVFPLRHRQLEHSCNAFQVCVAHPKLCDLHPTIAAIGNRRACLQLAESDDLPCNLDQHSKVLSVLALNTDFFGMIRSYALMLTRAEIPASTWR